MRSVDDRGEIALASGVTARLSGLRLPDEEDERRETLGALRQRVGETVLVASGTSDRWGRVPARIQVGAPRRDWAQNLVENGRALVDAGTDDGFCQPELLAFEETARERRLGLWAKQSTLPAQDLDALRAREGRFSLVEGRVLSVGERRSRTYLNFGRDFTRDFAVTVSKRSWSRFTGRGLGAEALRGRLVRVRGVIEIRRGPVMELWVPDMLEVREPKRTRS